MCTGRCDIACQLAQREGSEGGQEEVELTKMGDCCGNMLKYVIFLVNFVIFVTGCVVFGFGVAAHLKVGDLDGFMGENYFHSSIVLMVAGGIIILVTFFGCCGVCTENHCMLYIFGTLLSLILIMEIGAAVAALVLKDEADTAITTAMTNNLKDYSNDKPTQDAWGQIQRNLKCCGIKDFQDWANVTNVGPSDVPDSCCVTEVEGCGKGVLTGDAQSKERIYTTGCLSTVRQMIASNVVIVGGIAAGVVILQLIGIIVVCCLANRMREQKQYV